MASTRSARNTSLAGEGRNTSPSTAQLDAFPTSKNRRDLQSKRRMAVVSIRLTGDTVATLDRLVSEAEPGGRRYRMTRSELIQVAIADLIKARTKKGKAS